MIGNKNTAHLTSLRWNTKTCLDNGDQNNHRERQRDLTNTAGPNVLFDQKINEMTLLCSVVKRIITSDKNTSF